MSVRNTVKSIQDIMWKDAGVDGDAQRLSQLCWMFFLKIIDDQDQELELLNPGYRSPIPEKLQWRAWAANPEGITGDELLTFVNAELFPALKELPSGTKGGDRRRIVREVFEDAYNYMKSGQLMRQVVNKIADIDFNNLSQRQHFGDLYEQLLNDLQAAGNAGEFYTPRAVTAFMVDRIDPHPGEILFDPACGTGGFLSCALRYMRERYVKKLEDEQAMQQGLRAVEKKQLPHMLCVTNMLLHGIEDPGFVRHDNTLARPYISYTASDRVDIVLTNPPFGGREEDGIESNFPAHFRTRETADLFLALIIRLLKPGGRAAVVLPDGTLFGEGVKTRLKEHLMEECNLHTIVRLPNSTFKPYATIGTNLLFFEKGEPTKEIWFYEHRVPAGQQAYSMTKPIRLEHLQPCIEWWGGAKRKGREENEVAWRVNFRALLNDARGRAKPHWAQAEKVGAEADALKPQLQELRAEIKQTEKAQAAEPAGSKAWRKATDQLGRLLDRQTKLCAEQARLLDEQRSVKRTGDGIYDAVFNLNITNPHTVADDHGNPDELLQKLDEAQQEITALRDQLRSILKQALSPVSPARLITHFDRIADVPDALPRLRRFILDLAVRGKFVEHDLTDEPASKLIERIHAERARLVKTGEIGKNSLPTIAPEEVPFAPPAHWSFVRLGDALELVNGRAFKPSDWSKSGLPIVRIQNLNNPNAPFNYCDTPVPKKVHINTGDFLISWSGTPGTSFGAHIWDRGHAILNQHIFRAILIGDAFFPQFLKLAINSRLLELIDQAHGGVGLQHITKPKLEHLPLTLPPFAEQRRIVAKVEQLMAICDRLEAQLTTAQTESRLLLEAVLHEALATS